MKIVEVERKPQIEYVKVSGNPLRIWTKKLEYLEVYPGDLLSDVAKALKEKWEVSFDECCRLAAYHFALGERIETNRSGAPWTEKELDHRLDRRYLEDHLHLYEPCQAT